MTSEVAVLKLLYSNCSTCSRLTCLLLSWRQESPQLKILALSSSSLSGPSLFLQENLAVTLNLGHEGQGHHPLATHAQLLRRLHSPFEGSLHLNCKEWPFKSRRRIGIVMRLTEGVQTRTGSRSEFVLLIHISSSISSSSCCCCLVFPFSTGLPIWVVVEYTRQKSVLKTGEQFLQNENL